VHSSPKAQLLRNRAWILHCIICKRQMATVNLVRTNPLDKRLNSVFFNPLPRPPVPTRSQKTSTSEFMQIQIFLSLLPNGVEDMNDFQRGGCIIKHTKALNPACSHCFTSYTEKSGLSLIIFYKGSLISDVGECLVCL
jgi:hypothetical protein